MNKGSACTIANANVAVKVNSGTHKQATLTRQSVPLLPHYPTSLNLNRTHCCLQPACLPLPGDRSPRPDPNCGPRDHRLRRAQLQLSNRDSPGSHPHLQTQPQPKPVIPWCVCVRSPNRQDAHQVCTQTTPPSRHVHLLEQHH